MVTNLSYAELTRLRLRIARVARRQVRGHAVIDQVQHEHRLPFLTIGGMDGGQDQVIRILQDHARLGAGGVWRVEGDLGQECLARRIA